MTTSSLLALQLLSAVCLSVSADSSDVVGDVYDEYLQDNTHTCGHIKSLYKDASCCGSPDTEFPYYARPRPIKALFTDNPCDGTKPKSPSDYDNKDCLKNGVVNVMEQAGGNISVGYEGGFNTSAMPITTSYFEAGLCPVNVHWHLGTEHYSLGEFDEMGSGPNMTEYETGEEEGEASTRRLAVTEARLGFQCHFYDKTNPAFTTEYDWHHCQGMHVGQTYEVHWPHSKGGDCGTPWQYQSPFYDGVFCNSGKLAPSTQEAIGVQGQVFTIINDEDYYYPDLFRGMLQIDDFGKDITYYTGSTTGTTRNNVVCSGYAPITWQVDRKCHLISASSFDKMCADMLQQYDDMKIDVHAHGARELVDTQFVADNLIFNV